MDRLKVLEHLDSATVVMYYLHKKVWPAAQRDSCMLSHVRCLPDNRWMVLNYSTPHDLAPEKFVRIKASTFMVAQTVVADGVTPVNGQVPREHVSARITYLAWVNPGGWAPTSVVR